MSGLNEPNVVIKIGAEGGSITVVARASVGGVTEYSVRLRDQTLTFLAEGEADNVIRRDTQWSDRWDDVIASLGRWPWPMLVPLQVHPDYADRVLLAVEQYRGRDGEPARPQSVDRWTEACRSKEGDQR
jgi:hypothetical protein